METIGVTYASQPVLMVSRYDAQQSAWKPVDIRGPVARKLSAGTTRSRAHGNCPSKRYPSQVWTSSAGTTRSRAHGNFAAWIFAHAFERQQVRRAAERMETVYPD